MRMLTSGAMALIFAGAMVTSAQAEDPYTAPDRSWISLSGVVTSADDESFVLDYGEGLVTVEMDDWDWYDEGKGLLAGDDVIVYGRVDDDLYETATIEAGSVYVKNLGTFFYANPADEEDLSVGLLTMPPSFGTITLTGTVSSVDGREFTLDTGERKIRVDTIAMSYNPMDGEGFQKIEKGDRVRVLGSMDYDLFEKRELMADAVVTLKRDEAKESS